MITFTIIAVGALKERYLVEACSEYQKRLGAYGKLEVLEIPEYRLPRSPSDAQIRQGMDAEGRAILAKLPKGARLVALCIEGKALSSRELSEELGRLSATSSQIAFVIGGSHGVSDEVKRAAVLQLSMSKMTFPHQLARVMLLEQLYRAQSIAAGAKYHK